MSRRENGRLRSPGGIALVLLFLASSPAFAEYGPGDEPIPSTMSEVSGPMQRSLEKRVRNRTLFPRLKALLSQLPPFFSDAHVGFHARTYYFRDDDSDGEVAEAWAGGGGLWIESGWRKETFQVGAELFTSQPIVAHADRDGTGLLAPRQKGYTVLGTAYANLKFREHTFTAYRQRLELPYVNGEDFRMTPRTFEGYKLIGTFPEVPKVGKLSYTGGYLTKTKERNQTHFETFSEAAGVQGDADAGMGYAGILVEFGEGRDFGALNFFVADTLNTTFLQSNYHWHLDDAWELKLQGQFSHQTSVGNDALFDESFETWHTSGRAGVSFGGAILAAAFSYTDRGGAIQKPWGSSPSFLSIMQRDFDRAGEVAWLLSLSFDFAGVGLPGLSAFSNYAEGYRAIDAQTGARKADRREFDFTLDYRLTEGIFRGFWLRTRASVLMTEGEKRPESQVRVIVKYDIPIL